MSGWKGDDLVAWYRAQLDEDEGRAKRGQWTAQFLSQGGRKDPGSDRAYAKAVEREGGYPPARVLRDIEAKRRIIAEYERVDALIPDSEGHVRNELLSVRRAYRVAIQHHAAALDDRPGYRDEWRPA